MITKILFSLSLLFYLIILITNSNSFSNKHNHITVLSKVTCLYMFSLQLLLDRIDWTRCLFLLNSFNRSSSACLFHSAASLRTFCAFILFFWLKDTNRAAAVPLTDLYSLLCCTSNELFKSNYIDSQLPVVHEQAVYCGCHSAHGRESMKLFHNPFCVEEILNPLIMSEISMNWLHDELDSLS